VKVFDRLIDIALELGPKIAKFSPNKIDSIAAGEMKHTHFSILPPRGHELLCFNSGYIPGAAL
jgi:hypothetical protein